MKKKKKEKGDGMFSVPKSRVEVIFMSVWLVNIPLPHHVILSHASSPMSNIWLDRPCKDMHTGAWSLLCLLETIVQFDIQTKF